MCSVGGQKKKKLLVTASTFPRWDGDTEPRFVLDLSEALTNFYDVTVLVPAAPGAKDTEMLGNVHVIRYHYFPLRRWETLCYPGAIVPRIKEKKIRALLVPFLFFSMYFKLLRLVPKFDVVHAHWLIPQGIVQSFFRKQYIVTGHGGDVTSLNKGIVKLLKIRCLKRSKAVTVVSKYLKKEVQKLYNTDKIEVLPMGCRTECFSPEYAKPNFFNQGEKKVILFVGRLAEKKGVTYLIEAMKQVDALLVIVGDGPLRRKLEQQARELGDKVRFIGAKTHDELKFIYASADIFAAPSIMAKDGDQEGFGLVMLEAMASGLPVAASNAGGISDLVSDGVNGILMKSGDSGDIAKKLNGLLKNEKMRERLKKEAIATAEYYDYANVAERYHNLIDKVLG